MGRRAIRVMDLQNPKTLKAKLDRILAHHNALRRGLSQPEVDRDELFDTLCEIRPQVLPLWTRSGSSGPAAPRGQAHPV